MFDAKRGVHIDRIDTVDCIKRVMIVIPNLLHGEGFRDRMMEPSFGPNDRYITLDPVMYTRYDNRGINDFVTAVSKCFLTPETLRLNEIRMNLDENLDNPEDSEMEEDAESTFDEDSVVSEKTDDDVDDDYDTEDGILSIHDDDDDDESAVEDD